MKLDGFYCWCRKKMLNCRLVVVFILWIFHHSAYHNKKPNVDFSTRSLLFVRKIRKSVFDVGVSDGPNYKIWYSLTSTFLAFANESAWRNLDTFHDQKNSLPSTRRYFQGNSEARRTEIIQKREIGFHDNKNLISL